MQYNLFVASASILNMDAIPDYVIWAVVPSLVVFLFCILFLFITSFINGWNERLEHHADTRQQLRNHRDQFNPIVRWLLKI